MTLIEILAQQADTDVSDLTSFLSPEEEDAAWRRIHAAREAACAASAPVLMAGDIWREEDPEVHVGPTDWKVVATSGGLKLTDGHSAKPWAAVAASSERLKLRVRAGYFHLSACPRTAEIVEPGAVVSHPEWAAGAPVRITALKNGAAGMEVEYAPLAGGPAGTGVVTDPAERVFTLWVPDED